MPSERLSRGRRAAVTALLVVATVVAVAAIFAVWADRQLLDADNWADTSTELLADDDVRTSVAEFSVDQLYLQVDVTRELETALPPRLAPLAGPAAGALRNLAERAAREALGRPRVQEVWRTANRATAQQFINIAEGRSGAITAAGSAVVLDLRVVLTDLVSQLGLPGTVVSRIPEGAGRITILDAQEVDTLQNAATALDGFSVLLPLLMVVLLALAVFVARGSRRRTLLGAGWALIVAGAIVLVGRNVAGSALVDSVATTDAVRPTAESVWEIGTSMLRDVAQACVIMGIPLIIAAWLAGPTRVAVALRRLLAPWLRERPEYAYGAAVALALLVVWWGPIPATRMPLPVLLMFVLVLAGVAALRAQVAREFPDATVAGTQVGLAERVERVRAAIARTRPTLGHAGAPAGAEGAVPSAGGAATGRPTAGDMSDRANTPAGRTPVDDVALLERLAALHDRGALTDEEFADEKQLVLHGNGAAT